MSKLENRLFTRTAVVAAALFVASAAQAVDLRSWDMKINDVGKRFVVLASFNNQAVLDKESQLVWQISPGVVTSWTNALTFCHQSLVGGRAGWRLPSFSELRSLAAADGKLPAGHPFQGIPDQTLWSNTDSPGEATFAMLANLLSGGMGNQSKSNSNPHMCVRSAVGVDR